MTTATPEGSSEAPTQETMREITRNIERINESHDDLRSYQAETAEQMRETDLLIRELFQETDRRMRETDRQMKETDRRLKRAEDLFTTQWGKLMESLVKGDLVKLLRSRDVEVERLAQRTEHSRGGEHYELDILAVNGEEVVAVEVKTTLRPENVKYFRDKLARFKEWWPEYQDRRVYGAMAYLQAGKEVAIHAERQGFFVIRATGSSSSILNAEDFKPRVFA